MAAAAKSVNADGFYVSITTARPSAKRTGSSS